LNTAKAEQHHAKPRSECDWESITHEIIGSAYAVGNGLGSGFLEKPYENAMVIEIRQRGLRVEQQHLLTIHYRGRPVGEYAADLLVEDTVLVELKACRALDDIHVAQCLNYLKASGKPVCLLINFGTPKVQIRRILNPENPKAWIHPADEIEEPA
jgi:GxxExxY protein